MAQGGVAGNGIKVGFSVSSPLTWTRVNQVLDAKFPNLEADKIEITVHNPANNLKRYMPGLDDVPDPSFMVLSDFDPSTAAEFATIRGFKKNRTSVWWRFELPVNRAKTSFWGVEFKASVKNWSPSTPINGAQTTEVVLTFDGEDIYEDGSAGASEIT